MKNKTKTNRNRLSIYLIKEELNTPESILKDTGKVTAHNLNDDESFVLYTKDSYSHPPEWIQKFFLETPEDFKLENSSSQGLFLARIKTSNEEYRFFTIPFGVGRHLLKPGVIEERFGLKVVLNAVDETQLRSVDKKNMSNVPKQSREQVSSNSVIADFGIDIEQDLILGVTGKSKSQIFGKTITGKDALGVSVKVDINTIEGFLKQCFQYYCKDDYKENFGWIDQISEIKSKTTVDTLNESMIEKVKVKALNKLWMAIPEIIDWEDVEGFCYSHENTDVKLDDIEIQGFLKGLLIDEDYSQASLDMFTKHKILCYSSSSDIVKHQWKAFNCLYCEMEQNDSVFLLTNGKWYKIAANFVTQVNETYHGLLRKEINLSLPEYNHEYEGDYNEKVAQNMNSICLMDKKNITYGGGHSRIEFCDLFSTAKEMIHVKRYGGSSVLSHLFNQGLVSGELFRADKEFRNKVNGELPKSHKLSNTASIQPSEYKIIYAIISRFDKELNIPFFSKVSLKNAERRLEMVGYPVFLIKINTTVQETD
ncbi:MAG: TIGR04141 family sporadically distributed protein [Bacteroidetes bacterium]|nr:TIGR04141 family sporadically distributed protein [Bacteroidota bacterium]MBL7186070.1 TIGR04141 family sporadically distributed protein [Phycisphaerae bacterium]